jgi:hypothetical protein
MSVVQPEPCVAPTPPLDPELPPLLLEPVAAVPVPASGSVVS